MNDKPTGEPITEFEKYEARGPFKCGNCVHMKGHACEHPVMKKDSKQPRDRFGYPIVDSGDCCKFVRRKGD